MDPNSQHQVWSRWTYTVSPGNPLRNPSRAEVQLACAHFAVEVFGSTGQGYVQPQFNAQRIALRWIVAFRVEGTAVQDPKEREFIGRRWARFFRDQFGPGTHTHQDTKFEAGDKQDGTPREQLVIMPAGAFNFRRMAGIED